MRGIAETGFLLTFTDRNDPYHAWAKSVSRQIETPLLTREANLHVLHMIGVWAHKQVNLQPWPERDKMGARSSRERKRIDQKNC